MKDSYYDDFVYYPGYDFFFGEDCHEDPAPEPFGDDDWLQGFDSPRFDYLDNPDWLSEYDYDDLMMGYHYSEYEETRDPHSDAREKANFKAKHSQFARKMYRYHGDRQTRKADKRKRQCRKAISRGKMAVIIQAQRDIEEEEWRRMCMEEEERLCFSQD